MTTEDQKMIEDEVEALRDAGHYVRTVYLHRDYGRDNIVLEGIEVHHYPMVCPQCKAEAL